MHSILTAATALLGLSAVATAAALPAKRAVNVNEFPLSDGFPNPDSSQLMDIEQRAQGTLPNGPPPATISEAGLNNLRVIALNELFEVAFFSELLTNVTNGVTGYQVNDAAEKEFILKALTAVRAQEELHTLNANGALQHFNQTPIQPCRYNFPVNDLTSAISLAALFTDNVMGVLQDVIEIVAQNGDFGLTRGIASVVGQEGEQEGWYRVFLGKIPSELPFLTTSTTDIAVNALMQTFIEPNSCPNLNEIKFKAFQPLTLVTPPAAKTQNIEFQVQLGGQYPSADSLQQQGLKVVYINQQNLPIVEDFTVVSTQGNTVTLQALFPYDQNELNGLTIALLSKTSNSSSFADAVAASNAAVFGPAFIVNN